MPSVSKTSPFRGAEYLADQSFAAIRMPRTGQAAGVPMPELRYEHTGLWVVFAFRRSHAPKSRIIARVSARVDIARGTGTGSACLRSGALIANAFFGAGYIEAWGRGVEKIHRDLLVIWGERRLKRLLGEQGGEKVGKALTSNQRQILHSVT